MNLALLKSHSAPIHLEQIFDALLVGALKMLGLLSIRHSSFKETMNDYCGNIRKY